MATSGIKRVLVTGGNRGIGLAIAKGLKQLGMDVAIGSRNRADGEAAVTGTGMSCVELDVSDARSIEAAIASVGPFDVLVNNAGVLFQEPMLARPDEFEQSMAVMVEGPYRLIRACAPHMTRQGYGRIVNVGSQAGLWAAHEGNGMPYKVAKAGVIHYTRVLACDLGPYGINVNCIAPGAFPTDAEKIHPNPEGYEAVILQSQAIQRRGRPEDIANAVLFFASPMSDFITVQSLLVDGGWVTN